MGFVRRVWGWMRRHKIIVGISLFALLLVGAYLWLVIIFTIGDDLIMSFTANQTSFHITNAETAQVTISLSTANQLFCTARCELQLADVSTERPLIDENFTHKRGEVITRSYSLSPRDRGTGQVIYTATASCHNVRSFLCPTSSPDRRTAILLTVNYGLSGEEAGLKPALGSYLADALVILRDTDLAVQEARGIATTPYLRTAPLLPVIAQAEQSFAHERVAFQTLLQFWQDEEFVALDNLVPDKNASLAAMNATRADARDLTTRISALATEHNLLRDRLDKDRGDLRQALDAAAPLSSDPAVSVASLDAISLSDTLVSSYVSGSFTSYGNLERGIAQLESQTAALRETISVRGAAALESGNALISKEQSSLCALNIWCGTFVPANATAIPLACARVVAIAAYAGNHTNSTTNETVVYSLSNQTALWNATYCVASAQYAVNMTALAPVVLAAVNMNSTIDIVLPEHSPTCCVFGACKQCCNTASCKDDPATYPVVFVHGHAFNSATTPGYSLGGYFSKIQERLQADGYLDAGIITPSSTFDEAAPGEWGLSGKPITARVTYYYNFYKSGSDYVLITQKSENIETYALRLKEMIDIVRHHTGKDKVEIVAHSMGGLVVRRYLQLFGEDAIDKVIFIDTPNGGISGRTLTLCPLFGSTKECSDMAVDSVFMRKLNDLAAQPTRVRFVTITGTGCDTSGADGDGVATRASVESINATHYEIPGNCTDIFGSDLHTEILDVDKHPQVYDIIKNELR